MGCSVVRNLRCGKKKHAWFDASWEQQKQVFVTSGEGKKSKQNNQTTPRLQHDVQ